jgi:cell division septation protein DedD
VGSFNSADSAEALVAKLRLAGLPAFSEKVTSSTNTTYKVHIGPEINRDSAKKLAQKVRAEHGLDAFVTTQQ